MIKTLLTQRGVFYYAGENCDSIDEHQARGEGDKWYYDIRLDNGVIVRIFDPVQASIEEEEER